MNDKLLERADTLMHRRTFVAGAQGVPDTGSGPSAAAEDAVLAEVPVLTEVVDRAEIADFAAEASGQDPQPALARQLDAAVRERLGQLLSARQAELALEIETWLDEQMPQLVIRAMDGITDHLVALLANRARDELLPRLEAALRLEETGQPDTDSAD